VLFVTIVIGQSLSADWGLDVWLSPLKPIIFVFMLDDAYARLITVVHPVGSKSYSTTSGSARS
jgi:hypothetical protein